MRRILKIMTILTGLLALGVCSSVFASGITLSSINSNMTATAKSLVSILQDISLLAGIGFVMVSFFKFHQHKLNPTQVPMSQGISLLLIGAGLMVFPNLIPTVSKAAFGATNVKLGGSAINSIISST